MDQKTKKLVYRMLWIALGALTSTIVVGLVSVIMIYNNMQGDWVVALYFLLLLLLGILFGLICGRIAWEKVYVEGVRGDKYIREHSLRMKDFETKFFTDLKGFDIDKAMKWTITIFLIFLMVVMAAGFACLAVVYLKFHTADAKAVLEQIFLF